MNELLLIRSVNESIVTLCRDAGFSKVRRILIKIGSMKNVNPELMVSIFSMISKGTLTEGAVLSLLFVPSTFQCYSCGRKVMREDNNYSCPLCGSKNVKLLTGLEFSVESLEVEKNS